MKIIFLLVLFSPLQFQEYEKFFEVDGGPEYMYYFAKIQVGSPGVEQSAIIDTGSDTLAFPCEYCKNGDCGQHQDSRFIISNSKSFQFDIDCQVRVEYKNKNVCQFIKSYAEGSSLLGVMGFDYVKFKNTHPVHDQKLSELNSALKKDLRIKTEFGCTTKETGLFKTQYADGILGLDDDSSMIESMEKSFSQKMGKEMTLNFGLCFHESGGIMSVDLRDKDRSVDKIHYLNGQSTTENDPIIFNYNTEESYYEIEVKRFSIGHIDIQVEPIDMMVDSGTTFTHMPTNYVDRILSGLNDYCKTHIDKCGKLGKPTFDTESCLELKQPDKNYKSVQELLDSFPNIEIHISNSKKPYILYPKNYFYTEIPDDGSKTPGEDRICMALKGEEEGKIILGAFSMVDYYFYFDRIEKNLKIYKENCYLRTRQILMKRERILEENDSLRTSNKLIYLSSFGFLLAIGMFFYKKNKQTIKFQLILCFFQLNYYVKFILDIKLRL